jgi:hypothetical protein
MVSSTRGLPFSELILSLPETISTVQTDGGHSLQNNFECPQEGYGNSSPVAETQIALQQADSPPLSMPITSTQYDQIMSKLEALSQEIAQLRNNLQTRGITAASGDRQACLQCNHDKTRCDEQNPCESCAKKGCECKRPPSDHQKAQWSCENCKKNKVCP